jgi:hypothetical protein
MSAFKDIGLLRTQYEAKLIGLFHCTVTLGPILCF